MGNMKKYWEHALDIAERLNKIEGIKTIPEIPVCNMFHVCFDAPREVLENILITIIEKYNLGIVSNLREMYASCFKSEFSFGDSFSLIPKEVLDEAFNQLEMEFKNIKIS
jgi:hypothetical protein